MDDTWTDPLTLKELVRARTEAVIEHLGPLAPADALRSATSAFVGNSARGGPQGVVPRTLLLHTLRQLALASDLMASRRRRIERMLELAAVVSSAHESWAGFGGPPPLAWEAEAVAGLPSSWRSPRTNAVVLPFSGKRAAGSLALPEALIALLGSEDIPAIDLAFQRYLAGEIIRAVQPWGLGDERSRVTMAFASGLVLESVLGPEPAKHVTSDDEEEAELSDGEVGALWTRVLGSLADGGEFGRFDLVRAGFGLQLRLLPRLPESSAGEWHPALSDAAFALRRQDRGELAETMRWIRARLPFDEHTAPGEFGLAPAGQTKDFERGLFNPAFVDDRESLFVAARLRTIASFHQMLVKNEQIGGFREPGTPGEPITLRTVNEQVRGRRHFAIQQVAREASARAKAARAIAILDDRASRDGLGRLAPRSSGDGSTKAASVPWAADYLRLVRDVERMWWLLNRRSGGLEVPAQHILGASLHASFRQWVADRLADHDEDRNIVARRIEADRRAGIDPVDELPPTFEEWLRASGRTFPGERDAAIREWSLAQDGLLSERQRKRERIALTRYLDAIVRDETGVWEPLALAHGGEKLNGAFSLEELTRLILAEQRAFRQRASKPRED